MRIHLVTSSFYSANAAVVIPDGSSQALVVDPSSGVQDRLGAILNSEGARVGAVLATHGHPDHVWDCAEVASWWDGESEQAPVYIPSPDMYRLDSPRDIMVGLPEVELSEWRKPQDLRPFPAGSVELLEGLWMKMVPAPGHTEGSALFIGHCDLQVFHDEREVFSSSTPIPWAFSGDVIFSGSVGRTDLPGGDEIQMRHSLRTVSNALDPATLLLPGHGPITVLEREIASNPYLIRARTIG